MRVFIFGAGASLGSQENSNPGTKAPLTNQLFDDAYSAIAGQISLTPSDLARYRSSVPANSSLEAWLTDRWNEIPTKKTPATQASLRKVFGAITFYIWWLMQNVSNTYNPVNGYRLFMQKLADADEEFGIINFNYDTLLDRALMDVFGFTLANRLESYAEHKYIKPHGSVNWFLNKRPADLNFGLEEISPDIHVRIIRAINRMYDPTPIPLISNVIDPLHNDLNNINFIGGPTFGNQYCYPLILMPLTSKQYGLVEEFYEQVVRDGRQLVSQADNIYLIGYRAKDDVIKEILQSVKTGATVNVIGKGEADSIADSVIAWKPTLKKGSIFDGGFSNQFIQSYV